MFANARQARQNNPQKRGKESRRDAKAPTTNNGTLMQGVASGTSSLIVERNGPVEQKFPIFHDADAEERKPGRKQDGRRKPAEELLVDKENKLFDVKSETGAIPKNKNRAGLADRRPQVRTNVGPQKPRRRGQKDAHVEVKDQRDVLNRSVEQSPKTSSYGTENTPADYLIPEPDRGSSTCGISSQMKGIELTSAGGPIKKYVQVPFADLDVSGKKPLIRHRSASSFSSNDKDSNSEDDKESDVAIASAALEIDEFVSPTAPESQGSEADGMPTNCFAIPRPSTDKARVSLQKLQEEELCQVREYAVDIFEYLREQEELYLPFPGYMAHQPDLGHHMRCMLVDWLVEVAAEYKLTEACLFLAVSYVDRFLSSNKIVRTKLQLVGTTAMFIAAKVEEIYPPESEEFVFITDNTYTKDQLLKMEVLLLMGLRFRMMSVTSHTFYSKFLMDMDVPESVGFLAQYLLELGLMEGGTVLHFKPSVQAAAAMAVASHTLMMTDEWKRDFAKITGYRLSELSQCMTTMKNIWSTAADHVQQAVRQKYLDAKFRSVANIPVCASIPEDVKA